jgi:hypothetical protein
MSLRMISLGLVAALALGCGGDTPRSGDPTTAKEKQRREAAAAGETTASAGKRSAWRYAGDRDQCFFIVGRRCFKTEASACAAARCGARKCETTGGGPATVACAK